MAACAAVRIIRLFIINRGTNNVQSRFITSYKDI